MQVLLLFHFAYLFVIFLKIFFLILLCELDFVGAFEPFV